MSTPLAQPISIRPRAPSASGTVSNEVSLNADAGVPSCSSSPPLVGCERFNADQLSSPGAVAVAHLLPGPAPIIAPIRQSSEPKPHLHSHPYGSSSSSSDASHLNIVPEFSSTSFHPASGARHRSGSIANYLEVEQLKRSASPRPEKQSRAIRVYSCKEMEGVAKELVRLSNGRIELAHIDWNRFPDGFPNLFIHGGREMKWYHVAFLASFHSPSVIFEQMSVINAIPKLLPRSFKVLLPFFPTGTMERVSRVGEVATAASLARMLSMTPSSAKGPSQICIFDIHALQNQFYFKDTVLIRLSTCIPLLLARLAELEKELIQRYKNKTRNGNEDANGNAKTTGQVSASEIETQSQHSKASASATVSAIATASTSSSSCLNIAFPDDGAHKRFGDSFPSFPDPIICHKVRDGERRVVRMKEGDVKGKHIIIVDDLAQSGGTLIECAKELKRNGAAEVSCYVTHAIFPNDAWKKFTSSPSTTAAPASTSASADSSSDLISYFFITDSNPTVAEKVRGIKPFEVLSTAPLLQEIITDDTL